MSDQRATNGEDHLGARAQPLASFPGMSTQPMSEPDDDLPPHPDSFRDEHGILDRPAWVAALAEWRGADTEAAPDDEPDQA